MDSVESFREQFQCSICLDVFTEPVSTPCGHNFCMSCINSYWAHEEVPQCPLCKETFVNVPQLRVNTEFRDILDLFKKTRASGEDGCLPVHLGDVLCDFCCDVKCKAVKSCLICLASYCNIHLEPHHRVQALKWHTLINPVGSLEDRACTKHSKLKEFFCRNHQSCVCAMCMRDAHVTHDVVSLEEELKERRAQLVLIKRRVDQNLEEKTVTADRIQNSIKQRRQEVEKTKAETIKSFAALVAVIEAKKMKVIELLEEKQQAAEQEADVINQQLQREIEEDQRISTELIDLIKSEDDFRLLQALPSVSSHSNSMSSILRTRTVLHVETVKMAVTRTVEMLNEQMENVIRDVHQRVEEELRDSDTDDSFNDELSRIQQEYMTKVTLDPNTAHPCLIVSEDRKQVRDGGSKRKVSDTSSRFDCLHYVLGNEGFSSGRFYFEVTMEGQTMWEVGVTRDNISRKGVSLCLSPENGCWTLGSYWGRCQANTNPPTILPNKPERLGVFVDYNQKLVSFYDVDSRALIYSFTGCSFSAGTDASAGNSSLKRWVYTGTLTKTTLYPLFRPSSVEKDAPLQISPVRGTKRMN